MNLGPISRPYSGVEINFARAVSSAENWKNFFSFIFYLHHTGFNHLLLVWLRVDAQVHCELPGSIVNKHRDQQETPRNLCLFYDLTETFVKKIRKIRRTCTRMRYRVSKIIKFPIRWPDRVKFSLFLTKYSSLYVISNEIRVTRTVFVDLYWLYQ